MRRAQGRLSFSEKKFYEQVRSLLVSEFALALRVDSTAAETRVETALAG